MPPADSEPDSSAVREFQPDAELQGDDNGRSTVGSVPEGRLDAEPRLERALREVGDFLAGRAGEASRIDPAETAVREAVAAELLAVISGRESKAVTHHANAGAANNGTDVSNSEVGNRDFQVQQSGGQTTDAKAEQNRARQLFMDHGYFDEAVDTLRAASAPSERAAAARAMGIAGNRLGNVPLIAALFDDAPEVRDAATEALAQLGDSAAANAALNSPAANGGQTAPLVNEIVVEVSPFEAAPQDLATTEAAAIPVTVEDRSVSNDETKLLLEEEAARKALEELRRRLGDMASSRARLEEEAGKRLESETRLSAEAAARRREEEEVRQRAEAEALRRRAEEEARLAAAHEARVKAEEEADRFAQEDARLRFEINKLRLAAEELARTRTAIQSERAAAAERARLAETERARQEAEAAHTAEMERLRSEESSLRSEVAESALRRAEVEAARQEANQETLRLTEEREQLAVAEAAQRAEAGRLREAEAWARNEQEQLLLQVEGMRRVAEEVSVRRAEVEAAREKAIEEAHRLAEAQARMKAADEARQQAEAERLRLEAELFKRAEEQRRLLDEIRLRAQEAQQRLEEEEKYRAAEQEQRLAQLAALRERVEAGAQQRAEKERQISSQIESFRIADMQARKRIEDAEARRRSAEERHRLAAETAQRVEAEARKGELEQERILARLEEVRRNVAIGAQSAADQERRIKEETEQLRKLEEAQRRRIEEAARGRVAAEQRLQQERDRLQLEEDAQLRAAEQFNRLLRQQHPETTEDAGEWHDDPAENLRPSKRAAGAETRTTFTAAPVAPRSSSWNSPIAAAASAFAPALVSASDEFSRISARFDDPSPSVRNAAARELRELDPQHMVESFNRALEEASPERRRNIGGAIAGSGLAAEVIDMLGGESREETYSALCLLLTMAKSGEIEPLVQAVEGHENVYVRIAAVRLLTLNGQEEVARAAARRRLEGHI